MGDEASAGMAMRANWQWQCQYMDNEVLRRHDYDGTGFLLRRSGYSRIYQDGCW